MADRLLTFEEIAELRRVMQRISENPREVLEALRLAARARGTDHPERERTNLGADALATLNLAPFTPGGRFLHPHAFRQIHDELTRVRALLKRIEWIAGAVAWNCPACSGNKDRTGHRPECELAALIGRGE